MSLPLTVLLLFSFISFIYMSPLPFDTENWESGYISTRSPKDALYYFLFKNRQNNSSAPLLIWLNGGPGCSSMCGVFQENGPVYTNRTDLKLYWNPNSWNTFADVLYVDQPVGTGLSIASNKSTMCRDEGCVSRDFYIFFVKFLEKYPQYIKRPLYFSGESYAGRYLPAIAAYFAKSGDHNINLQGIAIGNPLTHLSVQIQAYPTFLKEHHLINNFQYLRAKAVAVMCAIVENMGVNSELLLLLCSQDFGGIADLPNPYDIREKKGYEDLDKVIETLMNNKDVQKYLGVDNVKFEVCNGFMEEEIMFADIARSQSEDIEYLLENNYDFMLYFGLEDYQCNWRGGEALMQSLQWKNKENYMNTIEKKWFSLNSKDAGHEVPLDQPEFALTLIKKFIYHEFDT